MFGIEITPGKNIRLFKNPLLERLTYVHPAAPLLIWGPVVAFCFSVGIDRGAISVGLSLALALAGLFFWTLAEYVLHRWVFHFEPRNKIEARIAFLIHGIHHDDPNDARRLLMPPVAAVLIALVFYGLFWVALGNLKANPFFAGFIVGYLCYDYIHFLTHFSRPKSKLLLWLKHNHMKHHFVSPETLYGVSNPLWDHVFRTTR